MFTKTQFAGDDQVLGKHLDVYNSDTHGCPGISEERHSGDLGNIHTNTLGMALLDRSVSYLDITSIVGRFLVIHTGEDDCTTQPDGKYYYYYR